MHLEIDIDINENNRPGKTQLQSQFDLLLNLLPLYNSVCPKLLTEHWKSWQSLQNSHVRKKGSLITKCKIIGMRSHESNKMQD